MLYLLWLAAHATHVRSGGTHRRRSYGGAVAIVSRSKEKVAPHWRRKRATSEQKDVRFAALRPRQQTVCSRPKSGAAGAIPLRRTPPGRHRPRAAGRVEPATLASGPRTLPRL